MQPLRFGILGAASIAPSALIKPARRSGGAAAVVAVAARDPERAQAFAAAQGIPRALGSYEALVADPEVDVVYNPLPNGLHGRWTLAALAAGKHVLCEKPFAANAEEAAEVAAVADASDRVVMEAFHYRYHPLTTRVAAIVESGELGTLTEVTSSFSAPIWKPGDIRYDPQLAGGAVMDVGCYPISLLRLLGGEPTTDDATALLTRRGVDRAMRARFTFPSGATGAMHCSMFSRSFVDIRAGVRGTDGRLAVLNPFVPQLGHRLAVRTTEGRRVEHLSRRPSYDFQLDAFVAAVRAGSAVPTGTGDAVANMAVIDDVYRAAGMDPRRPTL